MLKNTVRLLQLGLKNLQVIQGESAEDFSELAIEVTTAPSQFSLCYPNINSLAIESAFSTADKSAQFSQQHTIIFIDASWRKALKMWHLNPWLQQLTSWHFDNPPEGQYRIRQTKQKNGLSTLEAVTYVLTNTKQVDCSALLTLFLKMQQLRFAEVRNSNPE
ncbi:tRNA-uridine aminocarboxypropyltransferase [Paraglaciecola aquimarina]|uniref:tRNA-uridine aminocarboxypropyltransferase n=1 Tax=Paraglaciecola aquimarina TaxID=1235557 RepID=A0ABU3STP6_9ALTE|nr:tRNA-uridine aminocarboxypropyltransferase [Paraglaciecola aquimarina]MDU0353337.1 tRNA-uridine aminocarboxypropyltransferase [Paraglaciecola aquimarina]